VNPPWNIFMTRGFAIFLALLLSVELLLRWEAVEAYFPPRPYHSDEVELRRRAMRDLQQRHGAIDVLFQGNSSARTAISPLVFDRVVAEHGARRVLSYNGALSGMPPVATNFFLQHFYLDQIQPRVVVEGVTLAVLERPVTPERWDRMTGGVLEQAWRGERPLDSVRVFGMQHSRMLYYRGALGTLFRDVRSRPRLRFNPFPMDERGFEPRRVDMRKRTDMGETPPYESRTLDVEPALDAIRRTAELCRSLGIEYVLVRLPEHASRFPGENAVYREYGERLAAFSQRENIRYLDVVSDDLPQWSNEGMFNDAAHLTEPAARHFTTRLARAWLAASP
jgi:hypothetical protein